MMDDSVAAVIVAIMLIPQALALALVAGMPPETGLYASIFGLSVYAVFGTSSTLSVGPVAVLSLMTAAALAKLSLNGSAEYIVAALTLTLLTGIFLLALGMFRLGFMANFLSHPVISAFITASAIIIGFSQLQHFLGISASGQNIGGILSSLLQSMPDANFITLALGLGSIAFILWCKLGLKKILLHIGMKQSLVSVISKTGPVFAAIISSALVYAYRLDLQGVQILGEVPQGLPGLALPTISLELIRSLVGSAVLLSIIGFVGSISIAQTLAAKRRERIDLDQELVGLGAANIAVAFTGGLPVGGGFSRTMVNYNAGAATPAAGLMTALLVALVALFFTPLLFWLPKACLASIIIVAVLPLIDFSTLGKSWSYSKADFSAVSITLVLTLLVGVEVGIAAGVLASILIHLYKTSQPHVAVVGRVAGTEHFRNIKRHKVETFETLLSIRIDESLYFANTRYMEELIFSLVAEKPKLQHVILMCPAVNAIDMSALGTLEKINEALEELGIKLHLSEVKGPIMDKLIDTDFFKNLSGNNYLSQNQAIEDLKDYEIPFSGL
ncbi:MAG: sodium-independent anion transporter [SAR86 cluster bacterium]|uniref:Sodium-independent anion transporter n=1 Tax=SAR86 cluster bacterium TaxID=2030880 RepID=A0A2A5ARJ5_9GAMM|nr:MAG: sodium-independent anion transporter [SAR86 cluster bacterium]